MRALSLAVCLHAAACAHPRAQAPQHATTFLRYEASFDAELSELEVQMCFEGSLGDRLVPGRREASARLERAEWLRPVERPAQVHDGRIAVPENLRRGCLRYAVNLREGGSFNALVAREGPNLVASPNAWLWRPRVRPRKLKAELSFDLPREMKASVAWPRQGKYYRLPPAAFAFDSHAAFGAFPIHTLETGGIVAQAAVLGELPSLDGAAVERWLRSAVHIASQSDGRFPAPRLQVIVVPQPGGGEAFGSVARGGGGSVLMFVPVKFDEAELARDWVLPHELSHLLLPFLKRADAWLSEGFATYYQEVLRARAGVLSPREALSNLARGMRSAATEGTGRTLVEESRAMHRTYAYRAVYWGGAGYWLKVDVALRQETSLTLDALLSRLREEARLSPPYSADELLTRLDELSQTKLFTGLAKACETQAFPEVEPLLRALGAEPDGYVEDAELARVRAAIFAPQPAK